MGIETQEEDVEVWMGKLLETTLPAIPIEQMRDDTANDPELGPIVKEKQAGSKSKEASKGPYGKIWDELTERDGILLRGKLMVVPRTLQPRAIAHEGHMQMDGAIRLLRESQWFRDMRNQVKVYVNSCKCQVAVPKNATPPMKLKTHPKKPWH